jgi:hypothetical protein
MCCEFFAAPGMLAFFCGSLGVSRQDEQPVRRRVGRDHLQPVAVAGIVPELVGP